MGLQDHPKCVDEAEKLRKQECSRSNQEAAICLDELWAAFGYEESDDSYKLKANVIKKACIRLAARNKELQDKVMLFETCKDVGFGELMKSVREKIKEGEEAES